MHFDMLIIGGGAAGCVAALHAADQNPNLKICIIDRGNIGTSGIAAAAGISLPGKLRHRDSFNQQVLKDVQASAVQWTARWLKTNGSGLIERSQGLPSFLQRVEYITYLKKQLIKLQNVQIFDFCALHKLSSSDGRIQQAYCENLQTNDEVVFSADAFIVASGGIAIDTHVLGAMNNTGIGHLCALEHGASLSSMEFMHHFGLSVAGHNNTKNNVWRPATIFNNSSVIKAASPKFDHDYDVLAVAKNLIQPNANVYATFNKLDKPLLDSMANTQPIMFKSFKKYDMYSDRIPLTVCNEGSTRAVGGINIDNNMKTSLDNLYAVGDAASRQQILGFESGGAGPNSMWAIYSACTAVDHAVGSLHTLQKTVTPIIYNTSTSFNVAEHTDFKSIYSYNESYLQQQADSLSGTKIVNTATLADRDRTALVVAMQHHYSASLNRKESVGSFFRQDCERTEYTNCDIKTSGIEKVNVNITNR